MLPKLLFASMDDPGDIKAWSGTVYHLARMLEQQGFPMEYMVNLMRDRRNYLKVMERVWAAVLGRKPAPIDRRVETVTRVSALIEQRLRKSDADVIYSPGSIPLALLRTDRLKVFQTDATFAGILDQYPELSQYPKAFIQEGHELERLSLQNCDLAIYSSSWAARSAVEDYGADPNKVKVIPFGSNLRLEVEQKEVEKAIGLRSEDRCNLLFIGVHWQRKGGDVALGTAKALKAMGVDVHLDIIGCVPPYDEIPAYVSVKPFMDKRKPDDLHRLVEIIKQSHFLILPTKADCTPIVVNECNSVGVPCLTSNVGGLPEMIKIGRNGHLFEGDATASDYAECIIHYMADRQSYLGLAHSAYQEYRDRLGWKASGVQVKKVITELVAAHV